ncbi:MAG: 2-dehydropantoate 2-reductase [Anaerolineales bacterium]|nr:2-dehydropantoate 2-reductase [Anaerolineales bacterium]
MRKLRILSIGAGAIGTYIGGSLALAGHDVVFLERPETARNIREMSITREGVTHPISNPIFVSSIEDALAKGPFDAAIFATKSFDTSAAMDGLAPFAIDLPPFVCLQNGVENETVIAKVLGEDKVIPATVTTAIGKPGPGQVIVERLRGVGISNQHPLSVRLESAFTGAGLNPKLFDQPLAMKWSKLLTNLVANATSAILGITPEAIFSNPALFKVEIESLLETLRVMKSLGIPVVDLPGTPVRLLATSIRRLPLSVLRPLLKKAVVGGRGDKMPSFYIDMQAGRKQSEVTYLNGAVVRFGEGAGVSTPVNRFLTETLSSMAAGKIPRERYGGKPGQFLADLKRQGSGAQAMRE